MDLCSVNPNKRRKDMTKGTKKRTIETILETNTYPLTAVLDSHTGIPAKKTSKGHQVWADGQWRNVKQTRQGHMYFYA
jgi:hypothetical protein